MLEDEGWGLAQLVKCLPSMREALDLTRSMASIHSGGAEGEAGGSEVHSHPLLHSTFKASLCYMRLVFKNIHLNVTG